MQRKFLLGKSDGAIAEKGKTDYSILISENAVPSVLYAAQELSRITEKATGAVMPVVTKKYGPVISLGDNFLSREKGIAVTRNEVTRHGFRIKSDGDDVFIVSSGETGLIYAVQRYLELNLGYMYYAPDEEEYCDKLVKRSLDVTDFPDFKNRDVFNFDTLQNPENHIKLYLSGSAVRNGDKKYGEGSWWASLHDQSLALQIIPYDVYRASHPDWYVGGEGGSGATNPQICYTKALYSKDEYEKGDWSEAGYNSASAPHGMFWTFVYNLINNYIAVETDKSFFQLGMSDNSVFCSCYQCTADVEKYGRSGVALRFANAVADEVEEWRLQNCPEREIYLTMFAYLSIVDPPTVKSTDENGKPVWTPVDPSVVARDNIVIRYAPIGDYYMFSLLDEKENPNSYNAINGWKTVAKNFAVWDYRVDFASINAPFPQWMSAQDNIRIYRDMGVTDVFHQGCRTSGGTPFITMDNWVRSRMLWDADQEYFKLADKFIDVYYEKAGDAIREYIAFLTAHYKWANVEFGYKAHSHFAVGKKKKYFPVEFVKETEKIFAKGYAALLPLEKSAQDEYEKYKTRLDVESLFYRYCKLAFHHYLFDRQELYEEVKVIRETGRKKDIRVWFNTFDSFYSVCDIFSLQFGDEGDL